MNPFFDFWRGRYLFHFTDTRNLDSIREAGGLFSLRELQTRQILPVAPGGNQVSVSTAEKSGLDDFVSLCFFNKHPMEWVARSDGRLKETRFLTVDPKVLLIDGVKFCDGISNRSNATLLSGAEALAVFDLDAMTKRLEYKVPEQLDRRRKIEKYEVLVPKHIPLKFLIGI